MFSLRDESLRITATNEPVLKVKKQNAWRIS
jgi:hypothetical protein